MKKKQAKFLTSKIFTEIFVTAEAISWMVKIHAFLSSKKKVCVKVQLKCERERMRIVHLIKFKIENCHILNSTRYHMEMMEIFKQ